jgi:MOSC domain-containing protein YiiM
MGETAKPSMECVIMATNEGTLEAIALRSASRAPMVEVNKIDVSPELGLAGDGRGKPGARQVTVLSAEAWQRACDTLGETLPWTLRRANLLVRGLPLADTAGARIRIGSIELEVTVETDPCGLMDKQHAGLRAALESEWRGGVSCRVRKGGHARVGDPVWLDTSAFDRD